MTAARVFSTEMVCLAVLADPLGRALVLRLRWSERPQTALQLASSVRDEPSLRRVGACLRDLESLGLVRHVPNRRAALGDGAPQGEGRASEPAAVGRTLASSGRFEVPIRRTGAWALTAVGGDLCAVGAVMAQIAVAAVAPDQQQRTRDERLPTELSSPVDGLLRELTDVTTRHVLRYVAVRPRQLDEVHEACLRHVTVSRRTVARRVQALTQFGVLRRERVLGPPYRVRYGLAPPGRRLATVLLLAVWWEGRRRGIQPEERALAADLPALLGATVPQVGRLRRGAGSTLRWRVDDEEYGSDTLLLVDSEGVLQVVGQIPIGSLEVPVTASVRATPQLWHAALVGEREGELAVTGDEALVADTVHLLRHALFASASSASIRSMLRAAGGAR